MQPIERKFLLRPKEVELVGCLADPLPGRAEEISVLVINAELRGKRGDFNVPRRYMEFDLVEG